MKIFYIIIFFILLGLSNFFLLKHGLWFYQDQSFWPKNAIEAYSLINSQFHIFSTAQYYMGFDQGVFAFNNIIYYGFISLSTIFFGAVDAQIFTSVYTYVSGFIAFFLFSTIFFKDKKISYCLALLYVFCPLMYSSRGVGLVHAAAPLFVYSFFKLYTGEKNVAKYLLLNVIMAYLWISNVRFFQLNFFIVVPFLAYALFAINNFTYKWKKILLYFVINFLLFLPVFYSVIMPFLQHNPGIFNYGEVFNNFVVKGKFYDMFNPFQSINVFVYQSRAYMIIGFTFYIAFLLILLKHIGRKPNLFVLLNMGILLCGLTLFESGYIFGRQLYPVIIKIFPFLTNAPFYGLYVAYVPFLFLLGYIGTKNRKALFALSAVFITLATIPFLNTSNFIFQKYPIEKIPLSYQKYFIDSYSGISEATQYYPSNCWRANFMQRANTPTQCFNIGYHYKPVTFDNPRVVSGKELYLAKNVFLNPNIDNFQITHNLKSIIVAKDMVKEVDAGPLYGTDAIEQIKSVKKKLDANKKLAISANEDFNRYYFKNNDEFDFFIYSPRQIVIKNDFESIFDNHLNPALLPVVFNQENEQYSHFPLQKNVSLSYKASPTDPTKYYMKLGNAQTNKPFIIHLTQSFKPSWEVVWISKNDYEKIPCISKPILFQKTESTNCQYESPMIDLDTISYVNKPIVSPSHHVEGNYIGNTWIIYPQDIPIGYRDSHELYALILYKNQIYYLMTILVAGTTLLLLVIYTLMQEVRRIVIKKL